MRRSRQNVVYYAAFTERKEFRQYGKEEPSVQGRDQGDARPRRQFALLEEGDLPARAHLERLRRDRPREVPGPHAARARRRQSPMADPDRRRQGREDAHDLRQRQRHGRRRPGEEPRRDRKLRHEGLPRGAEGEGRREPARTHRLNNTANSFTN